MSQGLNKTQIIGFLGKAPSANNEGTVTRFSVAVTERWKDRDEHEKEHTEWYQVVAFEGVGAACLQFLTKGRQVYVEGRLRTRTYTDRNGEERTITELLASSVIFLGAPKENDAKEPEQRRSPGKSQPNGVLVPAGKAPVPDAPF
jgi:single-strand DNA-binding protein